MTMGKALNLECGGWLGADYDEPGQVHPVLTLVDWHDREHHPPQCLIVDGSQSDKMLHDIWW